MTPRNVSTPKIQTTKAEPLSPKVNRKKKVIKKSKNKTPLKLNNTGKEQRQRTATVPNVATPKPKQNKSAPQPTGSVVKSIKKSAWKRKPKPAHSGVPVPEKMKRLGGALFKDLDCSL